MRSHPRRRGPRSIPPARAMHTGQAWWRACCAGSTSQPRAPWRRSPRPMRSSRSARSSTVIPTRNLGSGSKARTAGRSRWSSGRRSAELPALFSPISPQRNREKRDAVTRQIQPVGGDVVAGRGSDGIPSQLAEAVERKVGRDVLDDLWQKLLGKEQARRESCRQIDQVDHRDCRVRPRQVAERKSEGDDRDGTKQDSIGEREPFRSLEPDSAGYVCERKQHSECQRGKHDGGDAPREQVNQRWQWCRPHEEVHLLAAFVRDGDPEAEDHHVRHCVHGHRREEVRPERDVSALKPLRSLADADERIKDDGQKKACRAECRYTPELQKFRRRLAKKHRRDGRSSGLGEHRAQWLVMAMNASSRSAPATSRSEISTPRRKISRSTDSGWFVSSWTLWSLIVTAVTGRPSRSFSFTACALKRTRLPATLDLISAGGASAMTSPRSITITRSAS